MDLISKRLYVYSYILETKHALFILVCVCVCKNEKKKQQHCIDCAVKMYYECMIIDIILIMVRLLVSPHTFLYFNSLKSIDINTCNRYTKLTND